MSSGSELAIDFGTSNTAAMLRRPDGRIQPVLFDGSPLLPSAVCREPSGRLLVGRDALAGARMYPGSAELNPKRCIDDGEIMLGGDGIPVAEVIGAVLRRAVDEARRVADDQLSRVVLSHPVTWGKRRQEVLLAAAERAGIDGPVLVAEPVAAVTAFVARSTTTLPVGAHVLVYDFGGGTFDASVVRITAGGFEVGNAEGLDDAGGLDIDAAVVASVADLYAARDPRAWQRLERPQEPADHRDRRQLWDDVCAAKEMLSRTSSAMVHVPGLGDDWPIGREQLERIARPVLDRTIASAVSCVVDAGLTAPKLGAVLLVGGSSRIPLVTTLLHQTFGIAPVHFDQPELTVAEGALGATPSAVPTDVPAAARLAAVAPPIEAAVPPARRRRWRAAVIAAVAVVAVLGAALVIGDALSASGDDADGAAGTAGSGAPSSQAAAAAPATPGTSGTPSTSESARPASSGPKATASGTTRAGGPAGSASPGSPPPPAGGSDLDISTNYAWARGSVSWTGTQAQAHGNIQDTAQLESKSWLRIAYKLNVDGAWKQRYAAPDPYVSVSNGQNKPFQFSLDGPVKDVQWDLCSSRLGTTYCTGWQ